MIVWLDAQLPPGIVPWLVERFGVKAAAVRDLGLRDATDRVIYDRARSAGAVIITKDSDFVEMAQRLGAPPQIVWLTFGNTSNARLREVFDNSFDEALGLLSKGEAIIEISGP